MKNHVMVVALATATILSGCAVTLPVAGPPPAGSWAGKTVQNGPGSARSEYLTRVALSGLAGGTVDYPSLHCSGRLTFTHMQGTTAMYREQLDMAARNRCIDNGIVAITAGSAGQVYFLWQLPGVTTAGNLAPEPR
jgi:hypothetical protein